MQREHSAHQNLWGAGQAPAICLAFKQLIHPLTSRKRTRTWLRTTSLSTSTVGSCARASAKRRAWAQHRPSGWCSRPRRSSYLALECRSLALECRSPAALGFRRDLRGRLCRRSGSDFRVESVFFTVSACQLGPGKACERSLGSSTATKAHLHRALGPRAFRKCSRPTAALPRRAQARSRVRA
jgi:hypothetical protein